MALRKRIAVLVVLAAAAVAAGVALALALRDRDPPPREEQVLQARPGLQWYRGNLHAHSNLSDGDAAPEAVAAWYREHGYDFLALTDHDVVPDDARWEQLAAQAARPGAFLLLRSVEISDAVGPVSVHVNAVDVDGPVAPARLDDVGATIEADFAAAAARARPGSEGPLLQLNHPNFPWAIPAERLMRMRGSQLFEVYNAHPVSNNPGDGLRPSVDRLWDIALAWRLDVLGLPPLYATATDDAHHYGGGGAAPGRGWVMVLADALEPSSLVRALRAGRFYASTGVRLERIVATEDRLEVEVAPEDGVEYRIEFIGTRAGFDPASVEAASATGRPIHATRRYRGDIGQVLASGRGRRAVYRFRDDDLYVRALVTASRRHPDPSQPLQHEQAWVQPALGPAARQPSRPGLAPPEPVSPDLHLGVTRRFQPMQTGEAARFASAAPARCLLQLLTDGRGRPTTTFAHVQHARFAGWLADPAAGDAPESLAILLEGEGGYIAESGPGRARPDIAHGLGKPAFERAGFDLDFELNNVAPGRYAIALVAFNGDRATRCETGQSLEVTFSRPAP